MASGAEAVDFKLPPAVKRKVSYEKDVLPLLKKHCYECHGADMQESGLRLDVRDRALSGGDSGKALVVGKSEESLLVQLTSAVDPEEAMPPGDEKLSDEQIGILRAWVDQGLDWPDKLAGKLEKVKHWSFQPIQHPQPPQVQQADWVKNPIDAFVLARLEALKIQPAAEADRATLIRRLHLDLLGLPPSPEDVAAFVEDRTPEAYEKVVDRLLASPHFGERWGRHWLDLARYADSDGYEKDLARPFAWRWRNWVIDSFNRDQPFDQFTIEQLAGDLLPNATVEQRVATGFHRNTLTNKEGGTDQEEDRVKKTVDRLNTTGTVWLGLTIGCAQCHTHKYDPFSHREYYQLLSFYNSLNEVDIPAPLPDEQATYVKAQAEYEVKHRPLAENLARYEREELPALVAAWEKSADLTKSDWQVADELQVSSTSGVKFSKQSDGSYLATGANPDKATYTITVRTTQPAVTAWRLEVLPDDSLGAKGPGRVKHGNFVLNEVELTAAAQKTPKQTEQVKLQNAKADFSQKSWEVAGATDGDLVTGWAISPEMGKRHAVIWEVASPVAHEDGTEWTFTLKHEYGTQHTIGRFRLSSSSSPTPVADSEGLQQAIAEILKIPAEKRTAKQQAELVKFYAPRDAKWKELNKAVELHAAKAPKQPATKSQAFTELPKPRDTYIHLRGDFLQKGEKVTPATLAVLPPLKPTGDQPSRLDFAKWLVAAENPLTSRVTMNRFWQNLFGTGLVATPDDFGTRGEKPSHPELLDWLATEFMKQGWSRKEMIKLIVMSSTYRQSSAVREELMERDPYNRLLARQNRMRMEAEIVRDLSLAASGLLTPAIGGPSIRPPQPPGVSELTYANSAKWVESKGPERFRRGMYIHFQRTSPYPTLLTFDSPDANVCCVRRERSNTPLQALTLLNDKAFVECAQALGQRVAERATGDGPEEKISLAFRTCLARKPNAAEMTRLVQLYQAFYQAASANPQAAAKLVGNVKSEINPAELAACVALSRTLMNLDEFITRE